jgi:nanoRNase/pAp phosphatase (c-di-AMP/oligoRNAs hydrolase)
MNSSKDINRVVLYHDNCLDGASAAAVAYYKLGETAQYIPVKYGEPVPTEAFEANEVYILDFCYSISQLQDIADSVDLLVILDHHAGSADWCRDIAQYESNNHCTIISWHDQEHSGAVIAWMYFFVTTDYPIPKWLLMVEDRDLWKFNYFSAKAFCAGLYAKLHTWPISEWVTQLSDEAVVVDLEELGYSLLRIQEQEIAAKLESKAYYPIILAGIKGLAINADAKYSSELGHELADLSGTFGAVWQYLGPAKGYQVSLRSLHLGDYDESVNVNALAKLYGGGGHKTAAGFRITTENDGWLADILLGASYDN